MSVHARAVNDPHGDLLFALDVRRDVLDETHRLADAAGYGFVRGLADSNQNHDWDALVFLVVGDGS